DAYGAAPGTGWIARMDTETIDRNAAFGADVPALRRPLMTSVGRVCDRFIEPTVIQAAGGGPAGLMLDGAPVVVQAMPYGAAGGPLAEKIDLNTPVDEVATSPTFPIISRAQYLGWLIWALENVDPQVVTVVKKSAPTPPATTQFAPRDELVAQLAANILDFR